MPVTSFRAAVASTSKKELAAVLAGTSTRYEALELVKSESDAILDALGVERPADAARLVEAKDATKLAADLAKNRKRLAFLRADAIGPQVRALAWGGKTLFGVDRLTDTPTGRSGPGCRPRPPVRPSMPRRRGRSSRAATSCSIAVWPRRSRSRARGRTSRSTAGRPRSPHRCKDCSLRGWDLAAHQADGPARGAFRHLVKGADIAIANFENPAPNKFRYHTSGTVFSADPKLIKGLAKAGIDWVGLANNHIGDAGGAGILQTIKNLKKYGIRSGGAGKNIAAARTPSILDAGGVKVAILAYDTIAKYYTADADSPGSARLTAKVVKADVKKARAAGADARHRLPALGHRIRPDPVRRASRRWPGHRSTRAPTWSSATTPTGPPRWRSTRASRSGTRSATSSSTRPGPEPTMEGITLELTFHGTELVQARMRPHIILDKAQPNFMDPAGSGKVVMGQLFDASKGLLPW